MNLKSDVSSVSTYALLMSSSDNPNVKLETVSAITSDNTTVKVHCTSLYSKTTSALSDYLSVLDADSKKICDFATELEELDEVISKSWQR
ncbi:MAG: hypothetical protein ACK5LL_14245 [Suipraeoptans sp.]